MGQFRVAKSARPEGVPYATLANPQTLNLYAYVGNNPVTHTDPDGHFSTWARRFGEAIQGKIEESGLEPIAGDDENAKEEPTKTQTQSAQPQNQQQTQQQNNAVPANSRQDVVLIPAGSGKPQANQDMNGMWTMDWKPSEIKGKNLEPPGSKYAQSNVALTESVNGGPFKSAGSQKGDFRDIISPESRTITQRFTIDGKRVQVVLGRDAKGNLIKTWDVKVTVKYPNAPVYSPGP